MALTLAAASLLAVAGCRQDMQNQPKFIPLRSSEFFPDHRSARYPIPGTVARGELREDAYMYSGRHGYIYGNELPASLTKEPLRALLERGHERYNIYCVPCHARVGDGNGMIVQRGFKHPPSFHAQRLRNAPLGYFYEVMSNGLGAMPDYAAQVKPEDRWAIATYIRALQLSQNAGDNDVAAGDRDKLNSPAGEITLPPTSFHSPTALPSQAPQQTTPPKGNLPTRGGIKP